MNWFVVDVVPVTVTSAVDPPVTVDTAAAPVAVTVCTALPAADVIVYSTSAKAWLPDVSVSVASPSSSAPSDVTAIDAAERNIEVAKLHAAEGRLDIDYRVMQPEDLARTGATFDVVINLEVVEHVADLNAFMAASAAMVKPGGGMVLSTINRTLKSLALAKVMAEYVLRWLPVGTHEWRKFVKPSELARGLRQAGMEITALDGMHYDPLSDRWRAGPNLDINYLAFAKKD